MVRVLGRTVLIGLFLGEVGTERIAVRLMVRGVSLCVEDGRIDVRLMVCVLVRTVLVGLFLGEVGTERIAVRLMVSVDDRIGLVGLGFRGVGLCVEDGRIAETIP